MKHFLANGKREWPSHTSSDFDERLFREYYSVPFRMGIEQGGSRRRDALQLLERYAHDDPSCPEERDGQGMGNDGLICDDAGALGMLVYGPQSFLDKEHGSAAAVKQVSNRFLDEYKPDLPRHSKTAADRSRHGRLAQEPAASSSRLGEMILLESILTRISTRVKRGAGSRRHASVNRQLGAPGNRRVDRPPQEREQNAPAYAKTKTIAVIGP